MLLTLPPTGLSVAACVSARHPWCRRLSILPTMLVRAPQLLDQSRSADDLPLGCNCCWLWSAKCRVRVTRTPHPTLRYPTFRLRPQLSSRQWTGRETT